MKKNSLILPLLYDSDDSSCSENEAKLKRVKDKEQVTIDSPLKSDDEKYTTENKLLEDVIQQNKKFSERNSKTSKLDYSTLNVSTPTLKRSRSMLEDDYLDSNKYSPKQSNFRNTSSFLKYLHDTRIFIKINLRCVMFFCESAKRREFYVAWMVRIKLSETCRNCCFNTSMFTPIRGRRSLPAERDSVNSELSTRTPEQPWLIDSIAKRSSYPIKSPQRSFHRSCATDQTPYSPVNSYQHHKRQRTALPYYNSYTLVNFKSEDGFIDSHCHLDFLFQRQGYTGSYLNYQKKHKDTFPECYKGCLAIFCNPQSFKKEHLWKSFLEEENVWASFGCHPHNAKDYNDDVEKSLQAALEHPKVRALGEIGLDYSSRNNCLKELQHDTFKRQLKIALEKKLPLVIHCREAHEDGMAIMKEIVPKDYFIHLHCFTDTWEWANKWIKEFPNLFIGITNVVTYPSAEQVHEVAKQIPLTRLLLETDSPYFVPRPLSKEYPQTKFSHPGMAIHVAAQIAALKGDIPLELVLSNARLNTKKMYKI